jgi:hypothetical protein
MSTDATYYKYKEYASCLLLPDSIFVIINYEISLLTQLQTSGYTAHTIKKDYNGPGGIRTHDHLRFLCLTSS